MSKEHLKKIHSVIADTTALNTGKFSNVNQSLIEHFNEKWGRDIHALECMYHINEKYLGHVISMVEGKKKVPEIMEEGLDLLSTYQASRSQEFKNLLPHEQLDTHNSHCCSACKSHS